MKRKRLAVGLASLAVFVAAPGGGAVASATVNLVIAHVVSHCHVWTMAPKPLGAVKTLGAAAKLTVRRGTRVTIRSDCPMDFDFTQTRGPRLALGSPRMYAGTSRAIVFRAAGVYKLTVTNVETPEERGLVTLGDTNTLTLTVVVKP